MVELRPRRSRLLLTGLAGVGVFDYALSSLSSSRSPGRKVERVP